MSLPRLRIQGVLVAAVVVLAVSAVLRCAIFSTLYDGDMELFVYMGKLAGQGGRIGIELIDNKLPTVGLLMWLPFKVIGAWWPGYALLGIVGAVLAVLAVTKTATSVNPSSRWPTAAMAATWMSFPLTVFSAFKLEHVTLATSALAAWAFVRCVSRRSAVDAVWVGLLAGVGMLAKPNALAVLAAAVAAIATFGDWPWRQRLRLAGWMLVGLAIPAAGTVAYLVGSGAIDAMPSVYRQIRSYNHNSVWQPQVVFFKGLTVAFLVILPLLMRGVLERRQAEPSGTHAGVVWRFALGWLTLEIVGIALQGRMYGYHFLPLTAPAAVVFGLVPRRPMAISLVGSAMPVLAASLFWSWNATLSTQQPTDRLAAIDYVKAHAAPGDAVWMDDYARLLVESDLTAGSRVPLTFLFSNDDDAPAHFGGMILTDLRDRRPRWVVLPTDCVKRAEMLSGLRVEYVERPQRGAGFVRAWAAIETAVRAEYVPVVDFGENRVYERAAVVTAAP